MMRFDFTEKYVVVTGGGNGIGRCLTESFLHAGARVAVIDTDGASGEKLREKYGDTLLFAQGDIADAETCRAFAKKVSGAFGALDILVNNACVSRKGLLSGCGADDFNYVLCVGVTAPYLLTQAFLPALRKGASIVNICSSRAFMSQADTESYTAAKGGILALTHAMSVSLAGRARVNSVSPGWIDTGAYQKTAHYAPEYLPGDESQHPAGRVGYPEDIAQAVMFLCADESGFVTGENITVDGGMTHLMIYSGDNGWKYDG
jgi:NAD(P)-dependent dehydrogenase (short-subunit alcohol dehydrogenase family)